jgi:hypothetical protein
MGFVMCCNIHIWQALWVENIRTASLGALIALLPNFQAHGGQLMLQEELLRIFVAFITTHKAAVVDCCGCLDAIYSTS